MRNYREYINEFLDLAASLRDRQLEAHALFVVIRRPSQEQLMDEYGDPVVTSFLPEEEIPIVPLHSPRDKSIPITRWSVENESYPTLEALARTTDFIPVRSLIKIPNVFIYPNYDDEFSWFEVLSTYVVFQEAIYGQKIVMVPHRGGMLD